MAEMSLSLYFHHSDETTHQKLVHLFAIGNLNGDERISDEQEFRNEFVKRAIDVNPKKGEEQANNLLNDLDNKIHELFVFESMAETAGYCVTYWVTGGSGDELLGRLVKFLYQLVPDVHAQGWGCGDDDPWEFWFKYEDGALVRHDDQPFEGNDDYIVHTLYRWWHETIPDEIREGFLNDEDMEGDEDDEERSEFSEEDYQQWLTKSKSRRKTGLEQEAEAIVAEEDYQQWLTKSKSRRKTEFEQEAEAIVAEEMADAVVKGLGGLFSSLMGGNTSKQITPHKDAFSADELSEVILREIFADMDQGIRNRNIDQVMKHYSKDLSGTTMSDGMDVPLNYNLYRMGVKILMGDALEYKGENEINDVAVNDDGSAILTYTNTATFRDPEKNKRVRMVTQNSITFRIIEGKVQATNLDGTELENNVIE